MNQPLNHTFDTSSKTQHSNHVTHHIGFRVTPYEKARLHKKAGSKPLSAYIRTQLLGDDVTPRKARRAPKRDDVLLCKVLAALGNSRLASNLNQIAKAANRGALPVTEELSGDLQSACLDIQAMRMALMMALGFKTSSEQGE